MKNQSNVLIIGARGIVGSAISKELVSAGYAVVGMSGVDVSRESEVDVFLRDHPQQFDHIIYSVSSPIEFKEITKESPSELMHMVHVQVAGLLYLVQKLLVRNSLKSIVAIGSTSLFGQPPARLTGYTTAKYALLGFMRSLVTELSPKGIRVNMISPGLIGEGLSNKYPRQFIDLTLARTPLKRLVIPADIAKTVQFLISSDAEYITGLHIPLDGGISLM